MHGLKKGDTAESLMPPMSATRFMSNSPHMLKHLHRRFDRSHKHQPLKGGRSADDVLYPLPLLGAIIRGMHDTAKADEHRRETHSERWRHIAARVCKVTKGNLEPGEHRWG